MLDTEISDFFSTQFLSLLVVRCSSNWGFDSLVRHLMVLWLIRGHVRDWHFSNRAVIVDLSVSLVVMLLSYWRSFGCIMRSSGTVVM